jgi:hypothetical protein
MGADMVTIVTDILRNPIQNYEKNEKKLQKFVFPDKRTSKKGLKCLDFLRNNA